jgi:hypothetical protein
VLLCNAQLVKNGFNLPHSHNIFNNVEKTPSHIDKKHNLIFMENKVFISVSVKTYQNKQMIKKSHTYNT